MTDPQTPNIPSPLPSATVPLSASPAATKEFIQTRRTAHYQKTKEGYYCAEYVGDVTPVDFTNPHELRTWYQSQLNILGATSKYILLQCTLEHFPLALKTQRVMNEMMGDLSSLPADEGEPIHAKNLDD